MMFLLYHLDGWRGGGAYSVPYHLRPEPRPTTMTCCPVFTRLDAPVEREIFRHYDVTEFLSFEKAFALPVAGDA